MSQNPTSADAATITDARGRVLTLRELNPADMLDLIEAGGSASENSIWMRYATMISATAAIDGMPVPLPNSKAQLRELARRLGTEGVAALVEREYAQLRNSEAEAAAGQELASAKN